MKAVCMSPKSSSTRSAGAGRPAAGSGRSPRRWRRSGDPPPSRSRARAAAAGWRRGRRPPKVDDERSGPRIIRVRVDHRMHAVRLAAPEIGAVVAADRAGDLRQPVAGGPAHHARKGVHGRPRAELPGPGIGLVEHLDGAPPELFEMPEQGRVAGADQAAVEEGVRRGQDDAAIGVVLDLRIGGVADPHRPHARGSPRAPCASRSSRSDARVIEKSGGMSRCSGRSSASSTMLVM